MVLLAELEHAGCQVELLERPMRQDPHDQLVLQIRSAVAEYDRTLMAERMRRGRQMTLRAGLLFPWTTTPYGYRVAPERPRDPAGVRIDPAEGAGVRELFTRSLEAHEPSGEFDVPMIFADKVFEQNGLLFFDLFNFDGIVGDKFTVNGKIQPFFQVHPRKYRFRWLDGGPSRFYQFFLTNPNNLNQTITFKQISTDGNLLPAPITVSSVPLSVAERCDVVIDFSPFAGQSLYLENRLEQTNGRGGRDPKFPVNI